LEWWRKDGQTTGRKFCAMSVIAVLVSGYMHNAWLRFRLVLVYA
jgi:hypothetical protein